MLTIPITLEASRTSPIREARRDLAVMRGGAVALALSIVDDAGDVVDLTGAAVLLQAFGRCRFSHDYGLGWWTGCDATPLFSAEGVMQDATTGQALIVLPQVSSLAWCARVGLAFVLADAFGSVVLARGILQVRGGPVTAALGAPGMVSVGDAVLAHLSDGLTDPNGIVLVSPIDGQAMETP